MLPGGQLPLWSCALSLCGSLSAAARQVARSPSIVERRWRRVIIKTSITFITTLMVGSHEMSTYPCEMIPNTVMASAELHDGAFESEGGGGAFFLFSTN